MPSQPSEQPSPKSRNEQYPAAPSVTFKDKAENYAKRRAWFNERNKRMQERGKS